MPGKLLENEISRMKIILYENMYFKGEFETPNS